MEEEVSKHTKKIFKTMSDKKHSFSEKVKEITFEILIIVFAVTLSIKLHEWSEHRHQQQEVKEFLSDLHEDLKEDIESLKATKSQLIETVKDKNYVLSISEPVFDSLRNSKDSISFKINFESKIPTSGIIRNNISGNYEGFKSSGKIGYIENKKIKKLMLKYYQQLIPSMTEAEKYYNLNLSNTGDAIAELSGNGKKGKEIVYNPKFKFFFNVTVVMATTMESSYGEIIKVAQELDSEILKEVK
jgi:hypothetical protein